MAAIHTGIVHQPRGKTTIEYLLLEEVKVKVWVVDVSSRIVLSQTFWNSTDEPTGRAKYIFPLPSNAAVCDFELELEDGTVIVGEVKEKDEAALTFTHALQQGKVAALVEKVTDDIFTISVGSIPASTRVVAHLTFVMDLLDEALRDHVRLQLPMHIAERYGTSPAAMTNTSAADSRTRVHITVDVQTNDVIYGIQSPTHSITLRHYVGHGGRKSQRRMSAVWKSFEFLASDFVITIHAEGLDEPRCFSEVRHVREAGGRQALAPESTVAMQLTLIPKFLSPKVLSQEYIFIIDRSHSMIGDSIETAKRTLIMLLRLLPSTRTTFNIFSFGGHVTSLWQRSHTLNPTSLQAAISHVESMSADYPGTEIPKALQSAFTSRGADRPAVVFLLTDGQVFENEELDPLVVIANAVQNSPPEATVRLFVLGIGTGVSQSMCSRLARQGNGECLFAVSAEDIFGKCARLLNAGRSKNIESINIVWGDISSPAVGLPSAIPNLPADIPDLEPPSALQQAPHTLKKIFSGMRFTVFAIALFKIVPTSVRLIIKLHGISDPQQLTVGVTRVKPFRDTKEDSIVPIVHTLAARKLIMELDDGVGPLPTPAPADALLASEADLRRAGIIRLGLTYQLASKHTSFVAIQTGSERKRVGRRGSTAWTRARLDARMTDLDDQGNSPEAVTSLDGLIHSVFPFITTIFGRFSKPMSTTTTTFDSRFRPQQVSPGVYKESYSDMKEGQNHHLGRTPRSPDERSPLSHNSTNTPSTLSSLGAFTCSSCWAASRSSSPRPQLHDSITRAPSPDLVRDLSARGLGTRQTYTDPGKRSPVLHEVYNLFREMTVDGSFTSTPRLTQIVGDGVLNKAEELGIDKEVWATVVVVAYVKTQLQGEPDLLDLMSEKAKEFVEGSEWSRRGGARRFEEMVREAIGLMMSQSSP